MPVIVLALAIPGPAVARSRGVLAPPGDSAVSQYVEVIPSDRGSSVPAASGHGTGGALTAAQQQTYDRLGAQGQLLVGVVNATSTAATGATSLRSDRGASGSAGLPGARPGAATDSGQALSALSHKGARSVAAQLLDAATGGASGGLGIWLPVLLVAGLLGVGLLGIVRRRKRAE